MAARKRKPTSLGGLGSDIIAAQVAAETLASTVAHLAVNLAMARDERHGVYADSARYDLGQIRAALALIEGVVDRLPVMSREGA